MSSYYSEYGNKVPLPVKNGLATRNARGQIGASWWARGWIEPFEAVTPRPVLDQGRRYARKGQIVSIDLEIGRIEAKVQGTREEPYKCYAVFSPWLRKDREIVRQRLSETAAPMAALLAKRMPDDVQDLLNPLTLYPRFDPPPECHCECVNDGRLCKHLASVCYILAELFDDDPFMLLHLRGVPSGELYTGWYETWGVSFERDSDSEAFSEEDGVNFAGKDMDALLEDVEPAEKVKVMDRLGFPPFFPAKDDTVMGALAKFYE
jgi:uncharacterized Zn finger protein